MSDRAVVTSKAQESFVIFRDGMNMARRKARSDREVSESITEATWEWVVPRTTSRVMSACTLKHLDTCDSTRRSASSRASQRHCTSSAIEKNMAILQGDMLV